MKRLLFLFAAALSLRAETILLWPNGAPLAQGTADEDKPTLALYPVKGDNKVSTGVIVCPGGGYRNLSMEKEGTQIAEWLNHLGISAFVLKYRLGPKYHHPVELGDAQRAIRYVRANAASLGLDPAHIGIWGFSAGGHLASSTGTHFDAGNSSATDPIDRQSSRPDFMVLAYPVVTMQEPFVHKGSLHMLLGENPDPASVQLLSNELQVTSNTPPTFLFHTTEDKTVPVENSVNFYLALRKAGVPAEMHVYLKGAHGAGLAPANPVLSTWPGHVADWLKAQGFR